MDDDDITCDFYIDVASVSEINGGEADKVPVNEDEVGISSPGFQPHGKQRR